MKGAWRKPLVLSVHVQGQMLQDRHSVKDVSLMPDADPDTPGTQISSPGYPSLSSGGAILHGGATLEVHF